jgi:signal transduction histidine kinase
MRQVAAGIQSRLEERIAERERIARELHDTLLQGVQGLILRFQAIMEGLPAGQPAKAQLNAALERADEVLISGRDRVRHLRTLGDDDISQALASAVKLAAPPSEIEVRINHEGRQRELHQVVAEEAIAIGREAILNALQHSHATRIDATIAYDRWGITLGVSDNGDGIDARILADGGREGHFGLIGMRERARKIRGKLTLAGRPGGGTVVALNVPARAAFAEPGSERGPFRWLRRQFARTG